MDSKNACSHSTSVASNTNDEANKPHNIPWSELPRSQQMAFGSIIDHLTSCKGHNKKQVVAQVDAGVNKVPPIVFVSDDCDAIDQSFNVVETNLNIEDEISTLYFPPSKKPKSFSTIDYDDDSVLLIHSSTSFTAGCTLSDDDISTGNAFSLTHYAADLDEIEFNYHGRKVIPRHETPVTIFMTNTIGVVCSRWLFRVLFDTGYNVCMIKKSALPHNLFLKELSTSQDVKTLAGKQSALSLYEIYVLTRLIESPNKKL